MTSPADLALAQRLEECDAWGNARCVSTLGALYPDVGAQVIPVAGGYAMYAGPDSPLTQAIGLGMNGPVTADDLERLEEFYRERGTATHIEVSALADQSLHALLAERGYRVEERSNVLARPLRASPEASGNRRADPRTPWVSRSPPIHRGGPPPPSSARDASLPNGMQVRVPLPDEV